MFALLRLLLPLLPLTLANNEFQEKNAAAVNKHCPRRDCSSSSSSSSSDSSFYEIQQQVLLLDNGFYPFNFGVGNSGLNAFSSFFLATDKRFRLIVTDCYCTGDSFQVYNYGTELVLDASQNCARNDNQCSSFSTDPKVCLNGVDWCKGFSDNLSTTFATYNFTIRILTSPYTSGTGYIAVQELCQEGEENFVPCCSSGPIDECNYEVVGDDSSSGCYHN